ncbi:hypothetical protein WA026_009228 [Henosepilachna vigintioctopunctata]|uniref:HTH OST-type domain-containing protein n=1 Tax=Henosepilachna vigintioctopunctata TaxID=420089 RepID=A0AAW1UZK3_9CUCU
MPFSSLLDVHLWYSWSAATKLVVVQGYSVKVIYEYFKMDETRRVLRVILISARTPLTVQKLTESYRKVTGSDIPLEELGYWDLFDFLSDLPELLSVKGNTLDSEVTLSQPRRPLSQKDKRPTENRNLNSSLGGCVSNGVDKGVQSYILIAGEQFLKNSRRLERHHP